jgi:putative ABC transport system permease protein
VRESMYSEFDQMYGYYQADLNADFPEFYPLDRLQAAVDQVPGVAWVEGWGMYLTNILRSDGQSDDLVAVIAPPAETRLVKPVVTEGRWLQPGDNRAIVLDNHFMKLRPDVQVGDTLQMRFNKQDYDFTVVGIFRIAGDPPNPLVYVNQETMAEISHMPGQVNALRIVTDSHDAARQNTIVSALQARFQEGGIEATLLSGSDSVSQKRSQTDMLTYLLMFMAVLIAAVGGLGLTGTMGMNVLERTREIGVMRAIGAQNGSIFQMVVVEGMLVGVISWGLSIVVAYPIAQMLDNRLGVSLLTVPLAYQPSLIGLALWLGIVLVLSAVASFLPARNAVRLTVRDVLAYE